MSGERKQQRGHEVVGFSRVIFPKQPPLTLFLSLPCDESGMHVVSMEVNSPAEKEAVVLCAVGDYLVSSEKRSAKIQEAAV